MIFCYFYVVNKSINGGTYSGAAGREGLVSWFGQLFVRSTLVCILMKKTLNVFLVTLGCIDTNWPLYFSLL